MAFKDTLGSIWPNYGAATGRGSYGQNLNPEKAQELAEDEEKRKSAGYQADVEVQRKAMAPNYVPMKKGGNVSSASARADGCCVRGKTKGRMV